MTRRGAHGGRAAGAPDLNLLDLAMAVLFVGPVGGNGEGAPSRGSATATMTMRRGEDFMEALTSTSSTSPRTPCSFVRWR
ncbi:hypothetical protein E2562_026938 [Oryza meyeriana var. granulata]|uniref:DUF834 domain-containing protein n=1 Tax=Oryza meyeriana var. granulata TaxID=110450 RepID=A0A6G1BP25_9ORYZ|nr:hypothetical protein E2562_026938 [Oryza meyeriana var. granulata]